ncbi:MAG: C45 family autoproteolytic acyltransferase/hydrolase [Gemmatimonadota bacterium]
MNSAPADSDVVALVGTALERGRGQALAVPGSIEPVRRAVALRLQLARRQLDTAPVRAYMEDQWRYHEQHAPDELAEMRGVAQGYGIAERDLFAYLHLGVVGDLADGCTAWARSDLSQGALLAKNRDFRGEHLGLQRVFRHDDPSWAGRRLLAVGSLGSPGVYSSGINSAGLALADTQIGTSDHGVGLLRYFLMTRILTRATTVDEALAVIRATAHAGGGSLVVADPSGMVAAIELAHRAISIERVERGFVARTNHFTAAETAASWRAVAGDAMAASSLRRLERVRDAPRYWAESVSVDEAFSLMRTHDTVAEVGLCRHGQDGDARTISCAVFALAPPTLYFSPGAPCIGARIAVAP